jgi:hypothetical protein
MPLVYERTRQRRSQVRILWIMAIVLGSILILGTILIASIDNFSWMVS